MVRTPNKRSHVASPRLVAENEELRLRLEEAEQALEAIRTGQVESLVVEGPDGPRVFSLEGTDHSYRVVVEAMNEGAATLNQDGTILYCNPRMGEMLERPVEQVMGHWFPQFLPEPSRAAFEALLREAGRAESRGEVELLSRQGEVIPAYVSISVINDGGSRRFCLVVADLRAQRRNDEMVAAEKLARSVIEQAAEAIVVCDEEGRIMRVSRAAVDLCGSNPLLRPFDHAFSLEIGSGDKARTRRVAAEVLDGAVLRATPATLCRSDGSRIELLVSATALRGADGDAIGCVINIVEITDLSRARHALEESEGRLRSVLENSLDAAYRRDLTTAKLDYLSPTISSVTGFTVDETCAMSADEERARVHPDDRAALEAAWAEAEHSGQLRADYRFMGRDGQYRWLTDRAVLVKDESGRGRYHSGVLRDVTNRKRAEMDLRRQAHALEAAQRELQADKLRLEEALAAQARVSRLYAVLSRVNEAIVRCRTAQELHERVCRILVEVGGYPLAWIGHVDGARVVPTAACGPAAEYLSELTVTVDGEHGSGPTGTSIREGRAVVNRDFQADALMGPWRERATRHGFRSSAAFPLRRGEVVIATLTLYASEPGTFDTEHTELLEALAANLSYAHDAIEDERLRTMAEESLSRSEAKLREADERKSQFLAVLSHELRNPLAPIKNSLYVLDHVAPGSDRATRAIAVIGRQVDQLARLVDDLLDVTRLTRGKLRLEPGRIDLVEVVRRTAEDHRVLCDEAGIELEVLLLGHPLWMQGDAARLAQALGNLLSNAVKFTPRGGKVTLSIDQPAPSLAVLRVRDTGVGIPKASLTLLFDPFVQVDSTLDRSKGGLGLGLALVKGVVEMHGGSVEAHSEGPGCGAEFIAKLPVEAADVPSVDLGKLTRDGSRPHRVLVVEDNLDAALSLRDALSLGGHQVQVAHDGCDAIAKAHSFRPHVVICDIGLPGMDGYELAKTLRADPSVGSAAIVALSGYAQPEDLQRSAAAGFDAHLAKPASPEVIEQTLFRLTKNRGTRRGC